MVAMIAFRQLQFLTITRGHRLWAHGGFQYMSVRSEMYCFPPWLKSNSSYFTRPKKTHSPLLAQETVTIALNMEFLQAPVILEFIHVRRGCQKGFLQYRHYVQTWGAKIRACSLSFSEKSFAVIQSMFHYDLGPFWQRLQNPSMWW